MKKGMVKDLLFALVSFLPVIYLAAQWPSLPETVAVHFNAAGEPDRYGSRTELWPIALIFTGAALLVYFLLRNLHKIDPKRVNANRSDTFDKLAAGLLLFLTALGMITMIATTRTDSQLLEHAMIPLLGLMFAFLGNYMYTVKPNYFAGIRTPWALSDDENWRKTHRLGGALWFAGGLLVAILAMMLPLHYASFVMMAIIVPMVLVPFVYSYLLFRKKMGNS